MEYVETGHRAHGTWQLTPVLGQLRPRSDP